MRSVGLVAFARSLNPIPSRTRPLNSSAPMVLCLKTWESRSLPGLQNACVFSTTVNFKIARVFTVHFRRTCRINLHDRRVDAGWSSPVARQAHNLKVVSSNLAPATKFQYAVSLRVRRFLFLEQPVRAANDSQDRLPVALTSSGS